LVLHQEFSTSFLFDVGNKMGDRLYGEKWNLSGDRQVAIVLGD
jgi:hypothetical protein